MRRGRRLRSPMSAGFHTRFVRHGTWLPRQALKLAYSPRCDVFGAGLLALRLLTPGKTYRASQAVRAAARLHCVAADESNTIVPR